MRLQHLRVLQERLLVVGAASAAVHQRLGAAGPAAEVHGLVPRLVDADEGGVDDPAHVRVREELAPVCEGHPVDGNASLAVVLRERRRALPMDRRTVPELSVVLHGDAEVAPLCVADLRPLLGAGEQRSGHGR